jgi:hypothetical protein
VKRRKRDLQRTVAPLPPKQPSATQNGVEDGSDRTDEERAARAAFLERLVMQGITAGVPGVALITQARDELAQKWGGKPKRGEVEEAVRRIEEQIRQDMSAHAQRDRARSYRGLLNVRRKLLLQFEAARNATTSTTTRNTTKNGKTESSTVTTTKTDSYELTALARVLLATEERLAKMAGWDEPERVHVEVVGPSDRLRAAMESFSDEEFVKLSAEQLEHERIMAVARKQLGLPERQYAVTKEEASNG